MIKKHKFERRQRDDLNSPACQIVQDSERVLAIRRAAKRSHHSQARQWAARRSASSCRSRFRSVRRTFSIHQGQTVLISDPDGQINWPSERGPYFLDTRVVSSWTVYANGEPWELLNGGPITYYAARIFLTNRSFATEAGIIPPRALGFTISRWIHGGMHEDLTSPTTA